MLIFTFVVIMSGVNCGIVPARWFTTEEEKFAIEKFQIEFEVLNQKIDKYPDEKVPKDLVKKITEAGVKGSTAIKKIMIGD
jgi:hypothetical protein